MATQAPLDHVISPNAISRPGFDSRCRVRGQADFSQVKITGLCDPTAAELCRKMKIVSQYYGRHDPGDPRRTGDTSPASCFSM